MDGPVWYFEWVRGPAYRAVPQPPRRTDRAHRRRCPARRPRPLAPLHRPHRRRWRPRSTRPAWLRIQSRWPDRIPDRRCRPFGPQARISCPRNRDQQGRDPKSARPDRRSWRSPRLVGPECPRTRGRSSYPCGPDSRHRRPAIPNRRPWFQRRPLDRRRFCRPDCWGWRRSGHPVPRPDRRCRCHSHRRCRYRCHRRYRFWRWLRLRRSGLHRLQRHRWRIPKGPAR